MVLGWSHANSKILSEIGVTEIAVDLPGMIRAPSSHPILQNGESILLCLLFSAISY
jgi:hypothetical protein